MARPTARVLTLLEVLGAGGLFPASGLAARLGVDQRTVRRYVAHLLELGVPVETVRGRHGGYRLAPGYRLPPLALTEDEALSVALQATDPSGRAAAAKIRRVLPASTLRRVDDLLAALVWTTPGASTTPTTPTTPREDAAKLLLLATAVRERQPVAVSYRDRHGRCSERIIHPYGIVAHGRRWYIPGHDTAVGEVRAFRLDRIDRPAPRPGAFTVPVGFDPATAVLHSLATTPWRHRVKLRIEATPEQIRRHFPPGLALVADAPDTDGWVGVELRAERLDWVPPLLAGLGRRVRVDQPRRLREMVHQYAVRTADDNA